jgi:peptidoglycan hydrolase CwlO-like protein
VKELQTALAAAETREADLQTQVQGLQADLETHQARLFELKDNLEQAQLTTQGKAEELSQVTAELAEAKAVILKMSAAPAPRPAPPEPASPAPPAAGAPPAPSGRAPLSVRMPTGSRRGAPRGIPEYAIQRGEKAPVKNTMLSDEDIGWVD